MSIMVAEPNSISSEKRIPLLHKEQITDKNSMIQMNLDTYESTITMRQNHDIPISEMMKQIHDEMFIMIRIRFSRRVN